MLGYHHQQKPMMTTYDNNGNSFKRFSASRNYQKDMLTLNSLQPGKPYRKPQPLYSMKRNLNKYYGYDMMQTSESQTYPQQQYGMAVNTMQPAYNYTASLLPMLMNNDASRNYYQNVPGTGAGYSFFNNTMGQHYNGSSYWNPYNYYYSPYYYNYYNNYYNYAKKYYEAYYAGKKNKTSGYYPKNITSITGFSQNSFDYEQSKRFGHRAIKHQGGSTKEEKARVILDIRPRVTIKMLNKTEQAMQDEELKKKKKDHIFKTHMEIIMDTTTVKPYYNNYDSYYGYNYGPE
ncbi:hypothetical protein BLA29_008933, partial [Euroglyphus maynei]